MRQGTPEWFEARHGHVTASRLADVFAGRSTKRRREYLAQLVAERLGLIEEEDSPPWMAHGKQWEPAARLAYALETGKYIDQIALVRGHGGFTASPDGLVELDGGVEIKCYKSEVEYRKAGRRIPSRYVPQVMGNLYATGRSWWDFVAYKVTPPREIKIHRVYPDPLYFERIRKEVYLMHVAVGRIVRRRNVSNRSSR